MFSQDRGPTNKTFELYPVFYGLSGCLYFISVVFSSDTHHEKQMSRTRNSLIILYSFQQICINILWFIFSIHALPITYFVVIDELF